MPPGREVWPTEQPAGSKDYMAWVAEKGSYKYQLRLVTTAKTGIVATTHVYFLALFMRHLHLSTTFF